ncbi:MAG: hypothetical protein EXS10_02165 [Phycisphaerales bacterium]|nr:hypothetical protein [Phycisphaerales bacterium]
MPRLFDDDEFNEVEESVLAQERRLDTYCPDCGASLHASADICPKCGMWVDGEALRKGKSRTTTTRILSVVVVILLILALVLPVVKFL